MDAPLNSCGMASFVHVQRNSSVSFSAMGSPSPPAHLELYLTELFFLFPRRFIKQNIAFYLWESVDSIVMDTSRHTIKRYK